MRRCEPSDTEEMMATSSGIIPLIRWSLTKDINSKSVIITLVLLFLTHFHKKRTLWYVVWPIVIVDFSLLWLCMKTNRQRKEEYMLTVMLCNTKHHFLLLVLVQMMEQVVS